MKKALLIIALLSVGGSLMAAVVNIENPKKVTVKYKDARTADKAETLTGNNPMINLSSKTPYIFTIGKTNWKIEIVGNNPKITIKDKKTDPVFNKDISLIEKMRK